MPETIGQRLKNIRLSRQLSLEKVAEATRVRAYYLQALENDDLSVMSSTAQARGFLRLYADFLGLDIDAATLEMRQPDSPSELQKVTAVAVISPPPLPEFAPQPDSAAADQPAQRGFWSRLLHRPVPQKPVEQVESLPEDSVALLETPPVITPAPIQVSPEPQPEPVTPRSKKAVTKKPKVEKVDRPKGRSKASPKTEGKKKAQLKSNTKRR